MMRKCPKCGSDRVAPILYGMPAHSEEMEQQLKDKKLYLGGCCVSNMQPTYHCFQCKKNVGTPPILLSKYGEEDYREIVTSIHFEYGGFFCGNSEILIVKGEGGITLDVRHSYRDLEAHRLMPEQEWNKLVNRLFSELYLHEWKKNYDNREILDGVGWDLELALTRGRVKTYGGSNGFPPYWEELQATFRPFYLEAGIEF